MDCWAGKSSWPWPVRWKRTAGGSSLLGCGKFHPSIDFTDGDRPCQEDANALFKELSLGGDSISVDAAGQVATGIMWTQPVYPKVSVWLVPMAVWVWRPQALVNITNGGDSDSNFRPFHSPHLWPLWPLFPWCETTFRRTSITFWYSRGRRLKGTWHKTTCLWCRFFGLRCLGNWLHWSNGDAASTEVSNYSLQFQEAGGSRVHKQVQHFAFRWQEPLVSYVSYPNPDDLLCVAAMAWLEVSWVALVRFSTTLQMNSVVDDLPSPYKHMMWHHIRLADLAATPGVSTYFNSIMQRSSSLDYITEACQESPAGAISLQPLGRLDTMDAWAIY